MTAPDRPDDRRLTADEIAVLEAAVEWSDMRQASAYGPAGKWLKTAERDLEEAVADLHSEHDGRWSHD